MKIATITFHWATNYGAVLQAYALQKYLISNDYNTEIINYIPIRVKILQDLYQRKNKDFFTKERNINKFREKHMKISSKKYYTINSLKKASNNYDIFICGSDQIWNESFICSSESKFIFFGKKIKNLSYYLSFVKDKKRISYATSFGKEKLEESTNILIKKELKLFEHIGVRENSGKKIVEVLGLKAKVVLDPTLLLNGSNYSELIENKENIQKFDLFSYILHNHKEAIKIDDFIYKKYFNIENDSKYNNEPIGIEEWLYNIKNSKFVVTNSFHGIVFSILFHTPFIAILIKGSGMNDRIETLLNKLNLKDRIIIDFDEDKIDNIKNSDIDWDNIDILLDELRKDSFEFLKESILN